MTSAPSNPHIQTSSRPATQLAVFLGPKDGTPPTSNDLVDYLIPLTIERSSGSGSLDTAALYFDLAKAGSRLVDLQTPTQWARQIEIRILPDVEVDDPDYQGPDHWDVLFWGDLTAQDIGVDGDGESAIVYAHICPYHFGNVLTGYEVYDATFGGIVDVDRDPAFNPLVKGQVLPNRSRYRNEATDYALWCEPEGLRTTAARTRNETPGPSGEAFGLWKLPEAIDSVSKMLNGDTSFIRNPDVGRNATGIFSANPIYAAIYDGTPELLNITLNRGMYLPSYLDALLPPHGFGWYVKQAYETETENDPDPDAALINTRRITIYKIGAGPEKKVTFQRPGETLDPAKQNVARFGVSTDIASLANTIVCEGSPKEYEITIELFPCWDSDDDAIDVDDLSTNKEEWPDSLYFPQGMQPGKVNVHRLWCAGEGGDYDGLRDARPITCPDLTPVLGEYVRRRRKIGPLLVWQGTNAAGGGFDDGGRRQSRLVEWWNPDSAAWERITWPYKLLDDQIGIYFSGETPPVELAEDPTTARVRITGTIHGDDRITATAAATGNSPNSRDVTLYVDVSDRFHLRKRQAAGGDWDGNLADGVQNVFDTQVSATAAALASRDDTTELTTYAQRIRSIEESALLRAEITLFGLHFDFEIGDLITEIDGRNISLNRNSEASATKKYLQITGIRFDYQQQLTYLMLSRTP